jgi:3-hydroxyisobutyrate dehydrogenase-like beta-hydroxyacid dehydrogenase
MKVGFIGTGVMGRPMARNVMRAGHDVVVCDRDPIASRPLVEAGATFEADPVAVAAKTSIVITMLPTPSDVEQLVLGPHGLIETMQPGSTFIDMSTGSPIVARRMAERLEAASLAAIDCPVGRTQKHAEAGTLLLMAGGRGEVIDSMRPVLMSMGSELIHCGSTGAGQAMKLVNNMLATVIAQANTEALLLGVKAGLTVETMLTVLAKTMAGNAQLMQAMTEKALMGDFVPGFTLELARKDVSLATDLAKQLDVPVYLGALTVQICSAWVADGWGKKDVGGILGAQAERLRLRVQKAEALHGGQAASS